MRLWLRLFAALALAGVLPHDALRAAVATAASALIEAAPLAFASAAIAALLRLRGDAAAYFGCGCGTGPSARSLAALVASWIVFGGPVAGMRFVAAVAVARLVRRRAPSCSPQHYATAQPLEQLAALLPAAALAGAAAQLEALVDFARLPAPLAFGLGAALAFVAAPCGLGAVAVASSLHARAPMAAAGFLCIAGIADARVWAKPKPHASAAHDALAYATLAVALAAVAVRHGAALVHPALSPFLAACAAAAAASAAVHRLRRSASSLAAPALALAGAFAAAPAPSYRATETTLAQLFAGERLEFAGQLVRDGRRVALVRYAIVCCRADATPVVVRLARAVPYSAGAWLRAEGTIATPGGDPQLDAERVAPIAPPSDPFVYR